MNRRSLLAAFGALPLARKMPVAAPVSLTIPARSLRLGDRLSFDGMAGTFVVTAVSARTMNLRQCL